MKNILTVAIVLFSLIALPVYAAVPEVYSVSFLSPEVESFSITPLSGPSGSVFRFDIKVSQTDGFEIAASCPPGIVSPKADGGDLCVNPERYTRAVTTGTFTLNNVSGLSRTVVVKGRVVDKEDGSIIDELSQEISLGAGTDANASAVRNAENSTPTTLSAETIEPEEATIGGIFSVGGGFVLRYFEWGDSLAFGNRTPAATITSTQTLKEKIGPLLPGYTYYYRAVNDATSDGVGERFFGKTLKFTTPKEAPDSDMNIVNPNQEALHLSGQSNVAVQCPLLVEMGLGATDVGAGNLTVSALQGFLKAKGYFTVSPTGFFGPITEAAVKKFQSDNAIRTTGYVGPLTLAKIMSLGCAR